MKRSRNVWFRLVPLVVLLVLGGIFFPSTGRDDSHILYWPAFTLVEHGTIVNYNGEFVQQASGLTHTILLAALYFFVPIDLVILGWATSVFFGLFTLLAVMYFSSYLNYSTPVSCGLLTATSIPFAYWTFSGMESTLYTFLVLLFLFAFLEFLKSERTIPGRLMSLSLLLLVFVRTEAPVVVLAFFVGCFGLLTLFRSCLGSGYQFTVTLQNLPLKRRNLLLVFFLVFMTKVSFQYLYFGSIFPLPLQAKILTGESLRIVDGMRYLLQVKYYGTFSFVLLLYFLLGGSLYLLYKRIPSRTLPLAETVFVSFLGAFLLFIVFSGGDWMEGARFYAPVMPVFYLTITAGLDRINSKFLSRLIVTVLIVLQVSLLGVFLYNHSTSLPVWEITSTNYPEAINDHPWVERSNKANLWDLQSSVRLQNLGRLVLQHKNRFVVFSGQGGLVPYYLAREFYPNLVYVDRQALVSSHLLNCRNYIELKSHPYGVNFSWLKYFRNRKYINDVCFGHPPDGMYGWVIDKMSDPRALHDMNLQLIFSNRLTTEKYASPVIPGYRTKRFSILITRQKHVESLGLKIQKNGLKYDFTF